MLANLLYTAEAGRWQWRALPIMLGVLAVLAIAYRFYSAFLAAKVAALDDKRVTPAHRFNDGQNYHPTSKWVLFGHHFAAIAGAGPLIGPVLAIQYGYFPGLLWLLVGVCFAGAVQDMLVLAASVRRGGKSLMEIARTELGRTAAVIVSAAILFIVVIALAGLGIVVVKALGGDEIQMAQGTKIVLPAGAALHVDQERSTDATTVYLLPGGCAVHYPGSSAVTNRAEPFAIQAPKEPAWSGDAATLTLPAHCQELVKGSSWGTFTIACTIPIALLMGLWMYRIRPGHIVEASVVGAVAVIAAVIIGNWVPGSSIEHWFALTKGQTLFALCAYGFIASVLPVWILLVPRDYLSSFLKLGTIALIVLGLCIANPQMHCPPVNHTFMHDGPTFKGDLFPFLFICIMCGAVSGFHALVSSGTTPKLINRESDIRPIGYGAMLMEGLVGIVALVVAASLPSELYYDINVSQSDVPKWQAKLDELYAATGIPESKDPLNQVNVDAPQHLRPDLAGVERMVGNESLRGRTGGAVTLAVGMALVFSDALRWTGLPIDAIMKYWYHFAIMFEALFILTTIDAGTRIARFLLQEALGKVFPRFERTDFLPGALLATFVVTAGWGVLIWGGSIGTIWPMFGIANQLLAVLALALVTTTLVNAGKARYAWVTILPMAFVTATTMTAGAQLVTGQFPALISNGKVLTGWLNIVLTIFVVVSVGSLLLMAASRWIGVAGGLVPAKE